jgi:predicted CopG family antitoxin
MMPRITVYLSDDTYYMLTWWAEKEKRSQSSIISDLLAQRILPEIDKELNAKEQSENK